MEDSRHGTARLASENGGGDLGRIVPAPEPPDLSAATIQNRIFIVNNTPYIIDLERGCSKNAPYGMLAVSMVQVQEEFGKIIAEAKRG